MRRDVSICFGLAAITLAVFWPIAGHDFINLDDPDYVTGNPIVQAGLTWPGLPWAFGNHASNWHPLTWLSHMLDCQLFGLKPGAHHLVSLGFHIASTLLLFLTLKRMTGTVWRSALVAALFAWHPLHIESVAWVAERKDVLSAFFFMLTLWAYALYAECSVISRQLPVISDQCSVISNQSPPARAADGGKPTTDHRSLLTDYWQLITGNWQQAAHRSLFYLLSLSCFALGLMSKPMLVTLPFVLLLLDYWPLGRLKVSWFEVQGSKSDVPGSRFPVPGSRLRTSPPSILPLLLEKVPFFALALAAGCVTLLAQHAGGAIESLEQLPAGSRLANALAAYAAYLGKLVWPVRLSIFYPHVPVPAWQAAASALLLGAVTVLCFRSARTRPCLLVGWAWFCVMLLPVIGLVQVGWQALADRYTYLPLIGVFIMLVWGASAVCQRGLAASDFGLRASFGFRPSGFGFLPTLAAGLVLLSCALQTRAQLRHWQNSAALFQHALTVTTDNWLAHNNLGTALAEQGKITAGAEHFRTALQINPAYDDARNNLGRFLVVQGQPDEARTQLETLVRRNPRHAGAQRNLGNALLATGAIAEGTAHYALARQLQPDDPTTPADLAAALTRQPESPGALPYLSPALALLPTADLRAQVASTWAGQGKFQFAVQGYRAALALPPQSPELLNNLAWILATCPAANVRDGAAAVRLGEHACELTQFKRPLLVGTLAAAYAEAGRFAEAVSTAQKACALATESGDAALAGKNRELLELYRAGQPYHEPSQLKTAVETTRNDRLITTLGRSPAG